MRIEITEFANRKTNKGSVVEYTWERMVDKLKHPAITEETIDEYYAMTNEERTEIKDVGGFVGGKLKGGVRRKSALENRTLLTIDADNGTIESIRDFELLSDAVYFVHTTHSSTEKHLRLRWVIPLQRPVTAEEYKIIANEVVTWVGADTIDETTDQPERLMFWPSVAFDGDFQTWEGGRVVLDPDEILGEQDTESTPQVIPQKEKPIRDGEWKIPEGQRNKTLFSYAATLRGAGLDEAGIRYSLSDYNERYCEIPLPEPELDTIVRSICGRYKRGASVMPTLRDAWDDFNDLGEWVESKPKKIEELRMESAESLSLRHIDPPRYLIDGLISCGTTILASPPKFGKSWMCMDMAISVATGTEFMGMKTSQDGVIYMALEDGDFRLQTRQNQVADGREIPKNLFLIKEAPILEDNLLAKLKQAIEKANTSIGMVIIDTVQKIRGVAGKTEGVYSHDYREHGRLHQFALDNNLALVLVTHMNKYGDDSDPVSRVNGSTGITGASDTIITLKRSKRSDAETKMEITGRDVIARSLIIQMDWSHFRWVLLGEEKDVEKERELIDFKNDPIVKTILWRLNEAENLAGDEDEVSWSATATEILKEVKRLFGVDFESPDTVGRKVKKLVPMLENVNGVSYDYSIKGARNRRIHTFSKLVG